MAFGSYKKGSRAEHELMDECVKHGFVVIRSAGSGKGSVCPDLLAFRRGERMAFECKAVDASSLALDREQFEGLVAWEETSGMDTYVAWRQRGGEWLFLRLEFFHKNDKSYAISLEEAKKTAAGFAQLFRTE